MKIFTINRKNFPAAVLKMKVGDLDKSKCSNMFLGNNLEDSEEVYVKCNSVGEIEYRNKARQTGVPVIQTFGTNLNLNELCNFK